MRIIVTGGGTGGHTSPAVAIIEELHKRDPRLNLLWVGRAGAIEQRVCESLSLPFRALPVEGWPRTRTLRRLWVALKLGVSAVRSFVYLLKFKPQLVLGVGGYVSLPLTWTAQRLGIPTVIHEQNKRLGMANRLLAPRATRIYLSFPETIGDFPRENARLVGNPVRAGFTHPPKREAARQTLGLDPALPVVLVSGGSQGAATLNRAMAHVITQFQKGEAQFLWMTGAAGAADARRAAVERPVRVDVFPFIDDMVTACAAADLLVGRAGASSTAEIAMLGKPSLLVPLPHADNHQEPNARAFEDAGASVVLLDRECTGDRLTLEIKALLGDPAKLQAMGRAAATLAKPAAAENIVEDLFALVFPEAGSGSIPCNSRQ